MAEKSPLQRKLVRLIETGGPMTLADYMHICMSDPEFGYYRTRDVIGPDSGASANRGDFITAPEISQMFGELIGVWLIAAWQSMDRPDRFSLVELGPGKGTLMNDILRAASNLPDFIQAADVWMVETSDRLADRQRSALAIHADRVNSLNWCTQIGDLPEQPALFVGNEFLDVLPVRQYVKTKAGWQEVGVNLDEDGGLVRGATTSALKESGLPQGAADETEGAIFEVAPAREAVTQEIATRIARRGGTALLIDYGHERSGFGDTLQAVRGHSHVDPMHAPGECDLTSHVDFDALKKAVADVKGVCARLTTQGDFLLAIGLLERAGALGSGKDEETRNRLRAQVERLAGPEQMGTLFKVMAIMPDGIVLPAFSAHAQF